VFAHQKVFVLIKIVKDIIWIIKSNVINVNKDIFLTKINVSKNLFQLNVKNGIKIKLYVLNANKNLF